MTVDVGLFYPLFKNNNQTKRHKWLLIYGSFNCLHCSCFLSLLPNTESWFNVGLSSKYPHLHLNPASENKRVEGWLMKVFLLQLPPIHFQVHCRLSSPQAPPPFRHISTWVDFWMCLFPYYSCDSTIQQYQRIISVSLSSLFDCLLLGCLVLVVPTKKKKNDVNCQWHVKLLCGCASTAPSQGSPHHWKQQSTNTVGNATG